MAEQQHAGGIPDTRDYPAYRFHKHQPPRRVETYADDAALGEGWRDHPYTDEEKAVPDAPTRHAGHNESEHPKARE